MVFVVIFCFLALIGIIKVSDTTHLLLLCICGIMLFFTHTGKDCCTLCSSSIDLLSKGACEGLAYRGAFQKTSDCFSSCSLSRQSGIVDYLSHVPFTVTIAVCSIRPCLL